MSAANTAARTGLKENFIIFNGDTAQDTMQKTVNGLTNNQAATFDFDSIEFKRPGTYVFSVVENAPENGNGTSGKFLLYCKVGANRPRPVVAQGDWCRRRYRAVGA